MNLPDFLTQLSPSEIRLTGHRIDLMHVVDLYQGGYGPYAIAQEFDLPIELINQVLAFYQANRREVDAYVADCHAEMDRFLANYRPGPAELKMRRLLERIKQADTERVSDPGWCKLNIVEKARQLEAEDSSEMPCP